MAGIIFLFGERKLADFFLSFCGFGSYESTIVFFFQTHSMHLWIRSLERNQVGRETLLAPPAHTEAQQLNPRPRQLGRGCPEPVDVLLDGIGQLEGEVVVCAVRHHDQPASDRLELGGVCAEVAPVQTLRKLLGKEEDERGAPDLEPVPLPRRDCGAPTLFDKRFSFDATL